MTLEQVRKLKAELLTRLVAAEAQLEERISELTTEASKEKPDWNSIFNKDKKSKSKEAKEKKDVDDSESTDRDEDAEEEEKDRPTPFGGNPKEKAKPKPPPFGGGKKKAEEKKDKKAPSKKFPPKKFPPKKDAPKKDDEDITVNISFGKSEARRFGNLLNFDEWLSLREDCGKPEPPRKMEKVAWKEKISKKIRDLVGDLSDDYKGHIKMNGTVEPFKVLDKRTLRRS